MRTLNELRDRAGFLAKRNNKPFAVVEIDSDGEGRMKTVQSLARCDEPEFEAFDGRILLVVHPDGSTE